MLEAFTSAIEKLLTARGAVDWVLQTIVPTFAVMLLIRIYRAGGLSWTRLKDARRRSHQARAVRWRNHPSVAIAEAAVLLSIVALGSGCLVISFVMYTTFSLAAATVGVSAGPAESFVILLGGSAAFYFVMNSMLKLDGALRALIAPDAPKSGAARGEGVEQDVRLIPEQPNHP